MIGIAAQISIYPLRQPSLAPAIDTVLQVLQEHGLDVQPGAMSSLVTGDDEAIFAGLREAFVRATEQGEVVMVIAVSNACPVPFPRREAAPDLAGE
ncbi:MAG: thiamine-binding protein [Anaerolineae bacterium]|nr:thiamine-binding protein [Anaerolineae bacterium]